MFDYLSFAPIGAFSDIVAAQPQHIIPLRVEPFIFTFIALLYIFEAMPIYAIGFNYKVISWQEKITKIATYPLLFFKWFAYFMQNISGYYLDICGALRITHAPRAMTRPRTKTGSICQTWLSFK